MKLNGEKAVKLESLYSMETSPVYLDSHITPYVERTNDNVQAVSNREALVRKVEGEGNIVDTF